MVMAIIFVPPADVANFWHLGYFTMDAVLAAQLRPEQNAAVNDLLQSYYVSRNEVYTNISLLAGMILFEENSTPVK